MSICSLHDSLNGMDEAAAVGIVVFAILGIFFLKVSRALRGMWAWSVLLGSLFTVLSCLVTSREGCCQLEASTYGWPLCAAFRISDPTSSGLVSPLALEWTGIFVNLVFWVALATTALGLYALLKSAPAFTNDVG